LHEVISWTGIEGCGDPVGNRIPKVECPRLLRLDVWILGVWSGQVRHGGQIGADGVVGVMDTAIADDLSGVVSPKEAVPELIKVLVK
jgi:hypothetical protein